MPFSITPVVKALSAMQELVHGHQPETEDEVKVLIKAPEVVLKSHTQRQSTHDFSVRSLHAQSHSRVKAKMMASWTIRWTLQYGLCFGNDRDLNVYMHASARWRFESRPFPRRLCIALCVLCRACKEVYLCRAHTVPDGERIQLY